MCDDAHDVAGARIDDGQTMHAVLFERAHSLEQRVVRSEVDEWPTVVFEHLAPCFDAMLFELVDFSLFSISISIQN